MAEIGQHKVVVPFAFDDANKADTSDKIKSILGEENQLEYMKGLLWVQQAVTPLFFYDDSCKSIVSIELRLSSQAEIKNSLKPKIVYLGEFFYSFEALEVLIQQLKLQR